MLYSNGIDCLEAISYAPSGIPFKILSLWYLPSEKARDLKLSVANKIVLSSLYRKRLNDQSGVLVSLTSAIDPSKGIELKTIFIRESSICLIVVLLLKLYV